MMTNLTKESIQALLDRSPAAVERALVVLFGRQTRDEQSTDSTHHNNEVGFSAFHARSGSKYAKWVSAGLRAGKPLGSCILNPWHKAKALKLTKHYWRQLIEAAKEKAAQEARVDEAERETVREEGCGRYHGSLAEFRHQRHVGTVRV